MKRISLLLCFLLSYTFCCWPQQEGLNTQLCNEIEKQYGQIRNSCFIFEHLGKWYFVSLVDEDQCRADFPQFQRNLQQFGFGGKTSTLEQYIRSVSKDKSRSFFLNNGIKKYPEHTISTSGIRNFKELEPIYETLKKNKTSFYQKNMPLVGKFKVTVSGYVYVYAQIITDANADKSKSVASQNLTASKSSSTANEANDKTVTLVVYGTATNQEEAIKIALRSAIEQAYGTFVSANTQIVNDELVRDEIVSVTSGNVEKYSIISSENDPDGKISVSVKATVSIGKLLQFAQSKGATAELAGATFAMNIKMRRLNKENEYQAICQMLDKMIKISELNLFDYTIKNGNPQLVKGEQDLYGIPTQIIVTPNNNYTNLVHEFKSTIESLSLSSKEQEEYKNSNEKFFRYDKGYNDVQIKGFTNSEGWILNGLSSFALRNSLKQSEEIRSKLEQLKINIWKSSMSFKISDNLGNSSYPIKVNYKGVNSQKDSDFGCDWPIYINDNGSVYDNVNIDIYGITSSKDSYNPLFMGGSIGHLYNISSIAIKKVLYDCDSFKKKYEDHVTYRFYDPNSYDKDHTRYIDCSTTYDANYIISSGPFQSCLDLSGKSFPFSIYLYYNEKDISNLSSITISPLSPKGFQTKTKRIVYKE